MTDLDFGPLCGLKGCREPMVVGAWCEAIVPGLGTVRVGLCLGHHDLISDHKVPNVSLSTDQESEST